MTKRKTGEIMTKCVRFVSYSSFLLFTQPQFPNGHFSLYFFISNEKSKIQNNFFSDLPIKFIGKSS